MAENPSPQHPDGASSSQRNSGQKRRRHVGSTADFVPTAPVVRDPSVPKNPSIYPTFANTEEGAKPKPKPPAEKAAHEPPPPVSGTPGMITFRFKQETLVLLGLVECSLVLGAFIFGHRVGKYRTELAYKRMYASRRIAAAASRERAPAAPARKRTNRTIQITNKKQSPKPARAPISTPKPAAAPAAGAGPWTLCVITYTSTQEDRAEQLRRNLAAAMPAFKVFVKKSGRRRLVCVGRFQSSTDPLLKELKKKVSQMIYGGRRQFKDCYAVKVRG